MSEPRWKQFIPDSIEPKRTGHSEACEDSETNECICQKTDKTEQTRER